MMMTPNLPLNVACSNSQFQPPFRSASRGTRVQAGAGSSQFEEIT
ncbi:hypothetical protein HDA44_001687 [Kribbella solani]|uniref:Uncharacterized protein n=1 Tax=Kribbella solani TaxID=236067 RepID=A0A841DNK0_9ACTN|nr:hypothetical protein [Kribbella solani]